MKRRKAGGWRWGAAALAAGFLFGGPARAGAPSMPDQPPPLVVGEVFRFVEGAWAEYDMLDKARDQSYVLRISILGSERIRRTWFSPRRAYRWMEFDIAMPGQPRVVVKCLARERSTGPGDLQEVILQIEGFANPIRLGRLWLRQHREEMVDTRYSWSRHRVDEREISHAGRAFRAWRVEAATDDGTRVEAVVSDALPPLGLYFAETPEIRMALRDWGENARSAIRGQPVGLTRWIFQQVKTGMDEEPQAP